jgi:hypothetical protein
VDGGLSAINLTGVWQGLYSYSRILPPVGFVATLIETASWVSGSIHEPHRKTGETLCATLLGRRDGSSVGFVKSYEKTDGYKHEVHYEGTVSTDGTEIDGRWFIRADWSGRFLMIRSRPRAEEVARKRFAEVW